MKQVEKDALLKAENDSYKQECQNLFIKSRQLKDEYLEQQNKLRETINLLRIDHYEKMHELNALEVEKSEWSCDPKVKNAIYATRKWLQDSLQEHSDQPVSVRFDIVDDVVTFSVITQ